MDSTNGTSYVNRGLSLLDFQERVFALATIPDRSPLERVKLDVPVTDSRPKSRIEEVLEVEMAGDVLGWKASPDGSWSEVTTEHGIDTHQRLLDPATHRVRGRVPYPS